jgi:uncharacterized protein YjbI with pentapeptide repeats
MWRIAVTAAVMVTVAGSARASDLENVNPSCTLVPEANCGWSELRKTKLAGKDLHDGQFMATRFDEADLSGVDFSGSHMQLANFFKANLKGANLAEAHLHAVNLQKANLEGANLTGVNLLDADLRGANLKNAKLGRNIMTAAKFSGATWIDGRTCKDGSIGECK